MKVAINGFCHRFLCAIGLHDWVLCQSSSKGRVEREIANEVDPLGENELRLVIRRIGDDLEDKSCLRCKKRSFKIDSYRNNHRARMIKIKDEFGLEFIKPEKIQVPKPPPPPPPVGAGGFTVPNEFCADVLKMVDSCEFCQPLPPMSIRVVKGEYRLTKELFDDA